MDPWFPGFRKEIGEGAGARINYRIGGSGPPLLLLHGYPQTHAMWHRIAPALAQSYTVVCATCAVTAIRRKPATDATMRPTPSARWRADMVEVMRSLGFPRFRLAGHDRGGRVSHRLCMDHPDAVERVARARHLAHAHDVPRNGPGVRVGLLPLVLPDPALRHAGADDRRRSALLSATQAGRMGLGFGVLRSARDGRVRALLQRSRPPSTRRARTIARRLRSTSSTTTRTWRQGASCAVRCSCCGATKASCIACSTRSTTGARWRTTCAAVPLPCGHYLAEEAPAATLAAFVEFFRG